MMKKIILTRGLPASGKSTWSKNFIKTSNGSAKRVNKDDLREMIDSSVWSKSNEKIILSIRDMMVKEFIKQGIKTIIVDDTNLEQKHFDAMVNIVKECEVDYTVEYKDFFGVGVDELIERDSKRAKPVGKDVIVSMHKKYGQLVDPYGREGGPVANKRGNSIIVDLDGTLALKGDRGWFEYDKVDSDIVNIPIANIVKAFSALGYNIIFVSGREGTDVCKVKTLKWLLENKLNGDLYMRPEGDHRNDAIIKEEIYNKYIKDKFDVEFVLDDRLRVVEMWRRIGLRCLQVAPGNF